MKPKGKLLLIVLLLTMLISFPNAAMADTNEYGYNAQARTFKGTLANWEAFMQGIPPTPFDWNSTDVEFIERKWDTRFDPMLQGNPPLGAGAWQKAELWKHLSGAELGWTWHQALEVVYSPYEPIPGAIVLTTDEMGIEGFYCVVLEEWMVDPNGKKTEVNGLMINKSIINRALHWKGWKTPVF